MPCMHAYVETADCIFKACTPVMRPCGKCECRSRLLARFAGFLDQQTVPGLEARPLLEVTEGLRTVEGGCSAGLPTAGLAAAAEKAGKL